MGHPYVWVPLNMCGHSHMFGCPPHVWMPPCLEDFWMPPVHTQHKESTLCHTKGCPYAPNIWMPHMFGCPICLDGPLYVWMPHMCGHPACLNAPYVWMLGICLHTPCMFGCPHMFGNLLYVWIMFGCPPYIHNTKKACFVTLRECPYAPYIWMPPVCLDAPCLNTLLYVWVMFGCPLYIHNT